MPAPQANPLGILFVGHGTRNPIGARDFLQMADCLAKAIPEAILEPAFMELQQPDIAAGVSRLAARGAQQIVVLPLLLFSAGHAKQDVPDAVIAALQSTANSTGSGITTIQAPHLGCHPQLLALSVFRIREQLSASITPDELAATCLIMIGRGSRDPSATAEMHSYSQQVAKRANLTNLQVGFVAMAQPSMASVFAEVGAGSFRRVLVVPHLLFEGDLLDQVTAQVAAAQKDFPHQTWLQAGILGWDIAQPAGGAQQIVAALRQIALQTASI